MRASFSVALFVMAACGGGGSSGKSTGLAAPVAALAHGPGTVDVDGVALAYEVRGAGPPCVAIPGGPGADSAYLRSVELEQAFTVVYVDPLGTGASGKLGLGSDYSLERDVAALEKLRVKLGLDKLCLIGHSYGGSVALRYAIDHPQHTRALVAYSTTPATDEAWLRDATANMAWFEDQPWYAAAMAGIEAVGKATTQAELEQALQATLPLYFADWSRDGAKFGPIFARSNVSFEASRRRAKDAPPFNVRAQLKSITAPTLVISGERDFICGPIPSRELATRIPGAKLVELKATGHFAHIENPAAFGAAVAELAASLR